MDVLGVKFKRTKCAPNRYPNIVEVYYISSPRINLVCNPPLIPTHKKGVIPDYQWATSDKLISVSNNHAFVIIIFTNIIK